RLAGRTLAEYFPGIVGLLERSGNRVLVPRLSPTDGIAARAKQLGDFLDRHSPGEPVHLIAHSMGGLDSRYLISRLGRADRGLSLTTVGTPPRGTSFASYGIKRLERCVRPLLRWLGMPYQAFYDLTPAACRAFNEAAPDAASVRYFSVAGRCSLRWATANW